MNIHIQQRNGMQIYHIDQWLGEVVVLPIPYNRKHYKEIKEQLDGPGVYILMGQNDDGKTVVYVGKADNSVWERWNAPKHPIKSSLYTKAFVIMSKFSFFTKYLEGRILVDILTAQKAIAETENGKAALLTNKQSSTMPLDPTAKLIMDEFYETWKTLIGILGLDNIFNISEPSTIKKTEEVSTDNDESPIFVLQDKDKTYSAEMKVNNGKFVVLKGSKCKKDWTNKSGNRTKYDELSNTGVLKKTGEYREFQIDYEFDWISAAAVTVVTSSVNGHTAWKVKGTNMTYKEWFEQKMANLLNDDVVTDI